MRALPVWLLIAPLLLAGCLMPNHGTPVYVDGWAYQMKIQTWGYARTNALRDFPVLVTLSNGIATAFHYSQFVKNLQFRLFWAVKTG